MPYSETGLPADPMMPPLRPSPERRRARARHNGLKSHYGADAPQTLAAREVLRALAAEEHIERIVAEAPPLTEGQRARLAALLLDGRRTDDREAASHAS